MPRLINRDWEDHHANAPNSARLRRNDRGDLALALASAGSADAQTKVTIGKVIGGDGFHVPTYVALDEGFFKAEGLDVSLVELQPSSQVTAVLSGNLDCAPIPSGGAQAALSGAKINYIVGESLKSQWTITTRQDIAKPEDLKGKTLGFGRPGGADYDEAQAVLHRFFHMDAGKDYKVISFQGEAERIAAMVNNDIQGAALSIPLAVVAEQSRTEGVVAHRRLHPARRRHHLVHAKLRRAAPRYGQEDHPRHRQGGDVFPHQQGRLDQGAGAPYRQHQDRRPRPAPSGISCTIPTAPRCRRICSRTFSSRAARP